MDNIIQTLSELPIFPDASPAVRRYFVGLGALYPRAMQLHRDAGLWEADASGKTWANVTEHCLMESARARVLSRLLRFSDEQIFLLGEAAAAHDFYKKEEIRRTREAIARGDTGREAVFETERESEALLLAAGFSSLQITAIQSVAGDPENTFPLSNLLAQGTVSFPDDARLMLYYIDNYTRGSLWAEPVFEEGGVLLNELDRRGRMNAENPAYQPLNEAGRALNAGHPIFDGMTRFEAAVFLGHQIESFFASRIADPALTRAIDLPAHIDACIQKEAAEA
jgi:hypothetical protein